MPQDTISIQLIRDSKSTNQDDLITIKPTGHTTVRMVFKDRLNKSDHTLDMSRDDISAYFINLFDILSYDREPYEAVQVNFPGYPCIYMSQKDFMASSARQRMQSLLWFALENSFPAIVTEREEREANAY